MIIQHRPPLHLTYCLNIHPGESWAANLAAMQEKTLAIKQAVAPGQWFGVGLRIAHQAAEELTASADQREEALAFFTDQQLYPFTINGFPYGRFHAGPVKENVYAPDWRTAERLHYTMQLADLLAAWLPEQLDGSISTVPCSFKPWIEGNADLYALVDNLAAAVAYLAALREDTGREIHLGLEPEPDCYLETTAETIAFFKDALFTTGTQEVARILKCYRSDAENDLAPPSLASCIVRHLSCGAATRRPHGIVARLPVRRHPHFQGAAQRRAPHAIQCRELGGPSPFCRAGLSAPGERPLSLRRALSQYDLPDALDELPGYPPTCRNSASAQ